MSIRDTCAIVGVGATDYYKRGQSYPETELSMACTAILAALADAGLTINDLDGFSIYSNSCDPATVGAELGMGEVRWATTTTSGGGGCVGALGVAAAAIDSGMATTVVSLMTLQQLNKRLGGSAVGGMLGYATMSESSSPYGGGGIAPTAAFTANNGLLSPGHSFAQIASRHMHLYGTRREHVRRGGDLHARQRDQAADGAAHRAAHARRLLQRPHDQRPAVPLRLHDGERRRGGGHHHVHRAGSRPQAAARAHQRREPRRRRPLGAGAVQVLPDARRVLHVVGSPPGGQADVRDGRPQPERRRRRPAVRPLLADGRDAARGLRVLPDR